MKAGPNSSIGKKLYNSKAGWYVHKWVVVVVVWFGFHCLHTTTSQPQPPTVTLTTTCWHRLDSSVLIGVVVCFSCLDGQPSSAMPIDANGDKCANFVVGRSSADDSAFNSTATASKIRNFFWVHIPKCGSTFEVSLYLWACPAVAYLATDAMDDDMTGRRASESSFSSGTCSFIKTFFTHNTQQGKVWCDASDARKRPHEPLTRQHLGRAMVLVRNPRQRLVSAFKNHLHCFGLQSREKLNAAVNASLLQDSSRKGQLRALELFANWPDVQGCQTKMLSGTDCCYPSERLKGVDWGEKLREATARLLDKQQVPFFGITDLYAPSICLFHAMHGAKLWDVELHNIHKTSSSTQTNKLDLLRHEAPSATSGGAPNWDFEGFNISDPLDQQLFDVALVEFKRRLIQYRDRVEPCCRDHGCAEYFAQVLKAATAAR